MYKVKIEGTYIGGSSIAQPDVLCPDCVKASENIEKFDGTSAVRSTVTVENTSDKPIVLNYLSAGLIKLPNEGKPWHDKDKYRVHYFTGAWQGEAQHHEVTLSELGINYLSVLRTYKHAILKSVGSWSTNNFAPTIFIEDLENGVTYFGEIHFSASWSIDIGIYEDDGKEGLFFALSSENIYTDGWTYTLNPGEKYKSVPVVTGSVKGDITDAVRELTVLRRKVSIPKKLPHTLLAYNDYMGALWGLPNDKKLIPLIDKASELGAEYFVIDDGWFRDADEDFNIKNGLGLGRWEQYDKRFGEYGFDGIINYIKEKGMKPGCWLEIEAYMEHTDNPETADCYLTRGGIKIGMPRGFLDMRRPEAVNYLEKVFDTLYEKGIRYIKNDYNNTIGIGCDSKSGNFAVGLHEQTEALYKFIEKIGKKYPDLVVENCASGSQRADGGILSRFSLTSTSDQMIYYLNPSIVTGSSALYQPEKCGIWTYSYSIPYSVEVNPDYNAFFNKDFIAERENGEETIFNTVTALMGLMYMSGHPEYMDDENFRLMKLGADTYKTVRDFTEKSFPIYPSGIFSMNDEGVFGYGLIDENNKEIHLAVWCINAENQSGAIDLTRYCSKNSKCEMIYPDEKYALPHCLSNGILTVEFPEKYSARLFKIKI